MPQTHGLHARSISNVYAFDNRMTAQAQEQFALDMKLRLPIPLKGVFDAVQSRRSRGAFLAIVPVGLV